MTDKKNSDVLLEMVPLKGKVALDIGCGDGALVRLMARQGARVTGIEINPEQLDKARAATLVSDETYVEGLAQSLPLANNSVDIVVFANSLHHVPVEDQEKALAETARVLLPGGIVFITEPLTEGPYFAVVSLVQDETNVRTKALEAIRGAVQWGLEPAGELVNVQRARFANYEAFRQRQIAVDPARASVVDRRDDEIKDAFERNGHRTSDGWLFDQPTRISLLRKRT